MDLNCCGIPLVEIVSEPDLGSHEEAYSYLTEIRRLVRWLDICDGDLEKGSLRCDANVSVALEGYPKSAGRKPEGIGAIPERRYKTD